MNTWTMKQAGGNPPVDMPAGDEVDAFVRRVAEAAPMERIELERQGVTLSFLRRLAVRLGISAARLFEILELPRTITARRHGEARVVGSAGHAALALVDLLVRAREIAESSTSDEAADFDVAKRLGRWVELPQPALSGRRPAELICTPTGARVVSRLLGALEGAAYQ